MTDVKDFFIASNTVRNAPDYDSNVLSTLIHTVEAFARVTYQSVYLIDYYKQEFLYVSDNPLFLCGHTAKEVKELGYSFYLEHVPEEEQKMLEDTRRVSGMHKVLLRAQGRHQRDGRVYKSAKGNNKISIRHGNRLEQVFRQRWLLKREQRPCVIRHRP